MRISALLLSLMISGTACAEPVTIASLDLDRYLGRWYEIASFPMYFQRMCVADTTAEYTKQGDDKIGVLNRCRKQDGSFAEAGGHASVVPNSGNAKLKVSFFWPFSADYWVFGLGDDYQWALVGNPNHKYLWLLSRSQTISRQDLNAALDIAKEQGFDISQLNYTLQRED
ncbi:lipocalin family protein [Iodobacter fluviatilis]|uniref:Outer membrane lipoprotein Blc n=1 Tax=Iodobacter fluviatilis TaxID=537 RepID=A0A377ST94_9NEIS|nr:lipocalin family protein [Iodobacter fluviatilis]TCU85042.1 apolipoprotein D and lipocalin family protein [Iodobacter fluviatilis]STR45274.1 Outer membrane lipoprotein blc precursor [Iodobacter fluviatilis]